MSSGVHMQNILNAAEGAAQRCKVGCNSGDSKTIVTELLLNLGKVRASNDANGDDLRTVLLRHTHRHNSQTTTVHALKFHLSQIREKLVDTLWCLLQNTTPSHGNQVELPTISFGAMSTK